MAIDLNDSGREAAFRVDVKDFIANEVPDSWRNRERGEDSMFGRMGAVKELRSKIADKGWIAPAWPTKYGGAGLGVIEQFVLNEEFAENGLPSNLGGFGVMMIGPTIIEHGTDEQKDRYLSEILRGDVIWCQGYSEPGAGSELASLQTKAVRDGDDYVINGQKI